MAYQSIGRGTSANDGTGDDLRTGAGKVNANFVELYTYLGTGSALSADPVVTLAATQTLTGKTITGTFTGNITGDVTGNVSTTSGNLQLNAATQIVEVRGDGSATEGQVILNCETNAHGQTIKPQPHSAAVTNTMLLPAGANSTLVSLVSADTLTNKSIDLTDNTVTGTMAELNTAISDETVVGRSTTDTLTNKTLADLKTSVQTLSGAGAIDVVTGVTEVTTTAADALTLANGTVGQLKIITMVADGGDGTITPTTFANGTTITMNDVGDTVVLVYVTTLGWTVINNIGCTVA